MVGLALGRRHLANILLTRKFSNLSATADLNGDVKLDLIVVNSNTIAVLLDKQYQATFAGSPAVGSIVDDLNARR